MEVDTIKKKVDCLSHLNTCENRSLTALLEEPLVVAKLGGIWHFLTEEMDEVGHVRYHSSMTILATQVFDPLVSEPFVIVYKLTEFVKSQDGAYVLMFWPCM